MGYVRFFISLIVLIASFSFPSTSTFAAPPPIDPEHLFVYAPETGHNIGFQIKHFFDTHGGVEIFGLPITEVVTETVDFQTTMVITDATGITRTTTMVTKQPLQVQYFERARFELHPELPPEYFVTLSRLGVMLTTTYSHTAFAWLSQSPDPERDFFPESGHTLGGAFRYFWQTHGGLPIFGYPISEEFEEVNPIDNTSYIVQYFERARFEYHPEHQGTIHEVQLGLLGEQLLNQHPQAAERKKPAPRMALLGKATTGYAASINERIHNIARATEMFNGVIVPPNTTFSFNAQGKFTAENGFVDGYAIIGGRLEREIAGGLCQVSTTMFRAVSNAGLKIVERHPHTFIVNFYENILGFDSTVYQPDLDLRWHNDTAGPIYMYAHSDVDRATVTFWIWGYDDGRTVTYEGPYTDNWKKPGPAQWEYDPKLPQGSVVQLVHGRSGVEVTYIRKVTMPDGSILHKDTFYTNYQPWSDFYSYGPGVKPRQ